MERDVAVFLGLPSSLCLTFISHSGFCVFCLSAALFVWDLCKYLNQIFAWFGLVCVNRRELSHCLLSSNPCDDINVQQRQRWCVLLIHSFIDWFIHLVLFLPSGVIAKPCDFLSSMKHKGQILKNGSVARSSCWSCSFSTSSPHNFFF